MLEIMVMLACALTDNLNAVKPIVLSKIVSANLTIQGNLLNKDTLGLSKILL
jgi:hypothetical protein